MCVVDRQHQRPVVGEVGGQPVQPVERPESRVSILRRAPGPSCPSSRLESPAAPAKRASRCASVAALTGCSSSWRATPNANSRSSTAPRASSTWRPASRGEHPGARHQPALADPRRRLDQKGASGALARPRDGFPEGLQLALALEQVRDRGRLGPHRRGRHPRQRRAYRTRLDAQACFKSRVRPRGSQVRYARSGRDREAPGEWIQNDSRVCRCSPILTTVSAPRWPAAHAR